MRFEQPVAAFARRMVIAIVREIQAVALFIAGGHSGLKRSRLHSMSWASMPTGSTARAYLPCHYRSGLVALPLIASDQTGGDDRLLRGNLGNTDSWQRSVSQQPLTLHPTPLTRMSCPADSASVSG